MLKFRFNKEKKFAEFYNERRDTSGPTPDRVFPDTDGITQTTWSIAHSLTTGALRLSDLYGGYNSDLVRLAETFAATYRAITLIASSISQLPMYLRDKDGYVIDDPVKEVPEHLKMITQRLFGKNELISGIFNADDMMVRMASDLTTSGNSFFSKVKNNMGDIVDLEYHPPIGYTSTVRRGNDGLFIEYKLPQLGDQVHGRRIVVGNRDVVHAQLTPIGPITAVRGQSGASPLDAIGRAIRLARYADLFMKEYFERGGYGNVIMAFDKADKASTARRIEKQLNRRTESDEAKLRKFAVVAGDPKITAIKGDGQSAQMTETGRSTTMDVAMAYGVPPNMMGIAMGSQTVSSLEELTKTFQRFCLNAYRFSIESAITRSVYGNEFEFKLDTSKFTAADLGALSGFIPAVRHSNSAEGQEAVMSVEEVRKMLPDFPKMKSEPKPKMMNDA